MKHLCLNCGERIDLSDEFDSGALVIKHKAKVLGAFCKSCMAALSDLNITLDCQFVGGTIYINNFRMRQRPFPPLTMSDISAGKPKVKR